MVEGLSMLIKEERRRGELQGIESLYLVLTFHLIFMDDMMLNGKGSIMEHVL